MKKEDFDPDRGIGRITFLVSDGLYFGEGPVDVYSTMHWPALPWHPLHS